MANSPTQLTHSGAQIDVGIDRAMTVPAVSTSDNGKIMEVVSGAWAAVTPVKIYSGSSTPSSSLGSDGDIYIQTS